MYHDKSFNKMQHFEQHLKLSIKDNPVHMGLKGILVSLIFDCIFILSSVLFDSSVHFEYTFMHSYFMHFQSCFRFANKITFVSFIFYFTLIVCFYSFHCFFMFYVSITCHICKRSFFITKRLRRICCRFHWCYNS